MWSDFQLFLSSNLYLDIEVACYKYEGVDAVKAALNKGLELSTEDMPIKVSDFLFPKLLPGGIEL